MAARLAAIVAAARADPLSNPYLSDDLARHYQKLIGAGTSGTSAPGVLELRSKLAEQWLNAGHARLALAEYARCQAAIDQGLWILDHREQAHLALRIALSYLRLGEEENCLFQHNAESCLLPIQGNGVHRSRRGGRGTMAVLIRHLEVDPQDLQARWLLNIAAMTVGGYPLQVPAPWRIPPRVFTSEADIGHFPDIAGQLGLDVDDLAGGVVVEDFDDDGWLDILVSSSRLDGPLRYFRSNRDGTFSDATIAAGLVGLVGGLNLLQTDYNNDGYPDVLVLRGGWLGPAGHHPNSLLRNNGDGTFEDVTEAAGLLSLHPTQTAVWFDFDGDGWLDLFVGNESTADDPNPCELFHNNGDGTFTEDAAIAGVDIRGFIKGVASADYNGDGRPDLYLSNGNGPNLLLRNDGPAMPASPRQSKTRSRVAWRFTDVAKAAGVTGPLRSFPTWFWDYDNDGHPDLFVAGYGYRNVGDIAADYLGLPNGAELPRLYRNNGDGTFSDVTAAAHLDRVLLAMGANFGDLDNDGWLDFYVGTGDTDLATVIPNRMFRNAGGHRFEEISTSGGFGHLQKGHGVAFADVDNDGDQDVYIVLGGALTGDHYRNALFLNPGHAHHWITLKLEGTTSNRAALGARVRVVIDSPAGERSIFRTVGSGGSFGASPFRQEIGLGDARAITRVEIHWPATGRTQIVRELEMDHFYRIREDEDWARRDVARSARLQ